jgi:formylglycine-generating enzyme required for sulfatase activity
MKCEALRMVKLENILPRMIEIPKGYFVSGSNDPCYPKPIRQILVQKFQISEVPVTRLLLHAVMNCLPENEQNELMPKAWQCNVFGIGRDLQNPINYDHPVVNITFLQANLFCEKLKKLTGITFRLPTVEECQKAARGINDFRKYTWGNGRPEDGVNVSMKLSRTRPVGILEGGISPFEVSDFADNVRELVMDIDGKKWMMSPALYGGSWRFGPHDHYFYYTAYAEHIENRPQDYCSNDVGFRLAI